MLYKNPFKPDLNIFFLKILLVLALKVKIVSCIRNSSIMDVPKLSKLLTFKKKIVKMHLSENSTSMRSMEGGHERCFGTETCTFFFFFS